MKRHARSLPIGLRTVGVAFGLLVAIAVQSNCHAQNELNRTVTKNDPTSRPISFQLDIQPILTSTGCNAGACHGKQNGQNGFQLSLLGFDSNFDYAAIAKESRGRRVFLAAPEQSLLLRKATALTPHGGGKRIEPGSQNYQMMLRWLKEGATRSVPDETRLVKIELNHAELLLKPNQKKQLQVTAFYSDGSTRDVSAQSNFQSNEAAIVAVNEAGQVSAGKLPGETAIMARYMNIIEVCHVAIPLEEKVDAQFYAKLPRRNFIDDHVWKKLERLNITPSQPIDDATFMRRVYTDIVGRIPTKAEAQQFLKETDDDKRRKLVDDLLESPDYAEFAANKWVDRLRTNPYRVGIKTTLNYDHWIRQQFRNNVPYDEFVRSLITARGSTFRTGAVTMYRDRRSPDELTTIVTQLFLGIRLECAKCHHHPFEKWSQHDFYSFAAYFQNVSRKGTGLSPPISGSEEIVMETGKGRVTHPANGEVLEPTPLFEISTLGQPTKSKSPTKEKTFVPETTAPLTLREQLATWMTSPENLYFAKVQVNRTWAELMGRGLVEPVDDIRSTNPPTNPELLDALAKRFIETGFDQKELIRTICNSYVYGLSSIPNAKNISDRLNYSRHLRHRMRAETLLDSLTQITGIQPSFSAVPSGSRATEIWTHRVESIFLDTFGRPNPNEDPPCMRAEDLTVTQSLHLMNSREIQRQITSDESWAKQLADSKLTPSQIVDELYLAVYSRYPTASESTYASQLISAEPSEKVISKTSNSGDSKSPANDQSSQSKPSVKVDRKQIEDLIWAMINTPEFSIQN